MFKKYFTLMLTVLVFNLFLGTSVFANTKEDKFAAKVKSEITKLGTGQGARVETLDCHTLTRHRRRHSFCAGLVRTR